MFQGSPTTGAIIICLNHSYFTYFNNLHQTVAKESFKTSLNWSHNGSKDYTIGSFSRNRCQRPLTNCHTAEAAGNDSRKMTLDLTIFPDIIFVYEMVSGRDKGVI